MAIKITIPTSTYPPQAGTGVFAVLAIKRIAVEIANKIRNDRMKNWFGTFVMSLNGKGSRHWQDYPARMDLREWSQIQLFAIFEGILRQLEAGEFIRKLMGFMNQCWQALGADIEFLSLESECDERSLQFRGSAVETSCV